jgi:anaerobic carbon-monoxide dehydrogenase iron sulfur subunit
MPVKLKLVTHPDLCRDCQACTLACSLYHEGECNLSLARLRVLKDMEHYRFNIIVCRHCPTGTLRGDEPDCMAACPNEALRLNEWGVPAIFREECLLCGSCQASCSYDALFYDNRTGFYLKCDLCSEREEGPVCAQVCPVAAITVETVEMA